MRIRSIASGSSGNSIYVGSDTTHILIDTGVSGKKVINGLNDLDIAGNDLDAILITHEHIDHIKGLGVISRKFNVPIYATENTIEEIKKCSSVGQIDDGLYNVIKPDERFRIKDMDICSFSISHDAADPVGYRLESENKSVAVATDLGIYDDYIVSHLQRLDAIFLEANHDVRMLQMGPYPYQLKQRILGRRGHLSNELSGRLLASLLHDNMKHIILSHLSKENNMPELAYEAVRMEVSMADNPYHGDDFDITVAKRDDPSAIFVI